MPALVFTIEGTTEDLQWIQPRIDGAIHEVVDDNVDDGRIEEDAVQVHWTWDD